MGQNTFIMHVTLTLSLTPYTERDSHKINDNFIIKSEKNID